MSWEWTRETLDAAERFLTERGLAQGGLSPCRIGDGHSNLTYLIGDVVLRRPPPPPMPKGAHDVLREARILTALEGTGVPVPRVLATAQAGDVLDVPFYVMSRIDGDVVTDRLPARFADHADRRAMGFELADRMAQLHAVDWQVAGLADFGRPDGFNTRHLDRYDRMMRARGDAPMPPGFDDLADWLRANIPAESGATIVHSDFRLGNVMWAKAVAPPRIAAILDWELATIGDPLLDLAYLAVCHPMPGEPLTPTQKFGTALLEPGFPGRDEVVRRYGERSGRDVSGLGWYCALASLKLAVLYDFSHRQARDSYYADAGQIDGFIGSGKRFAGLA